MRATRRPDIERLIDQHGEEAVSYAAGRANLLLEDGDVEGAAVWRRVMAAIEGSSGEGGTVRR